jgi:hypothetical protein
MEGDRGSATFPQTMEGRYDDGICQRKSRKSRELPRSCPQFCCLSQGVHFQRRLA